jgi:hypothetical protein
MLKESFSPLRGREVNRGTVGISRSTQKSKNYPQAIHKGIKTGKMF